MRPSFHRTRPWSRLLSRISLPINATTTLNPPVMRATATGVSTGSGLLRAGCGTDQLNFGLFGGGGGTALGSAAAERNLNRITTVLALAWLFSVVALGMLLT